MNGFLFRRATLLVCGLLATVRPAVGDEPDAAGLADVKHEEVIVLNVGPAVRVTFDDDVWRSWKKPEEVRGKRLQGMSWHLRGEDDPIAVRVYSLDEQRSEEDFERQMALGQAAKNDAGTFVRARREKFAGREWRVLEYRYATRKPTCLEFVYFSPTKGGSVQLSVFVHEAKWPDLRDEAATFLSEAIDVE